MCTFVQKYLVYFFNKKNFNVKKQHWLSDMQWYSTIPLQMNRFGAFLNASNLWLCLIKYHYKPQMSEEQSPHTQPSHRKLQRPIWQGMPQTIEHIAGAVIRSALSGRVFFRCIQSSQTFRAGVSLVDWLTDWLIWLIDWLISHAFARLPEAASLTPCHFIARIQRKVRKKHSAFGAPVGRVHVVPQRFLCWAVWESNHRVRSDDLGRRDFGGGERIWTWSKNTAMKGLMPLALQGSMRIYTYMYVVVGS